MTDDRHEFGTGALRAAVLGQGAELCSLRYAAGRGETEYLWQAGPAWPRHAPLLFPIVGRLKDNMLRHEGRAYQLGLHGFARECPFTWLDRSESSCRLLLVDAESRAAYPFAFRLEVEYAARGDTLDARYTVHNPSDAVLPASVGAHPGFRWPLARGVAKDAHRLVFEAEETRPLVRLDGGLTVGERPTPIEGRILTLHDRLFGEDGLMIGRPASTRVRYEAENAPVAIEISWERAESLVFWSKPGGPGFVTVEPWRGQASEATFDGAFHDAGVMQIPAGGSLSLNWQVTLRNTA